MKIRIKGNSVRFRLTKSEVSKVISEGSFTESCTIGGNTFKYMLKHHKGASKMHAHFKDDQITVCLTAEQIEEWKLEHKVGFEIITEDDPALKIIVEKDFVCLDETTEDQSDNYPNPKAHLLNG